MVEAYTWLVYREWRQTGCEMEDGSDTRKDEYRILLIPEYQEEEYMESCADEYGYQDYSYRFDTKALAKLDHDELLEISYKWIMALEDHDILRDKEKFGKIATKIQNILKDHEEN